MQAAGESPLPSHLTHAAASPRRVFFGRRIALDLFCGRGGWSAAAAAAGFTPIGFDVEDHGYPWTLHRCRLPTFDEHLRRMRPAVVFASPPCEDFARAALPWIHNKPDLTQARSFLGWALSLIGRLNCPVIVECSRFAARDFPGARFAGSYALWGDLPALLPDLHRRKSVITGKDGGAVRRAVIEPDLASWLVATLPTSNPRQEAATCKPRYSVHSPQ